MAVAEKTNVSNAGGAGDTEEKLLLPLPKWKIWYIMVVIFILLFFDFATRVVVGPLFPLIKAEFNLTDAQLGLLNTVTLIMVTVLAMPLSYVIDRWRRGKMMSLMAIVWSLASLVSGLATNFGVLLTGRAALGVAEASYNSGGQTMIMATIKKRRRTTVTGFLYTGMMLGIAGGMALGGVLGAKYGWRNTLLILAVPGLLFGILAWFMPDFKNPAKSAQGAGAGIGAVLKSFVTNKSVMLMVIAYAFVNFLIYTTLSWLPTYLIRYDGMDIAKAGSMAGVVMVTALIAMPIGGWLGDMAARKSARTKILVILLATTIGTIADAFAVLFNFWPLFIVGALGVSTLIPPQQVSLQELVPAHQRASVFGFYYAGIFILGGLWAPFAVGAISDAVDLKTAFWVAIGIAAVAIIVYAFVYKSFNNDYFRARQQEQDAAALQK
ncbi:MAG: MFS transporter [Dehalococcoidia bacterium]